ncbi:DUF1572 domain-containing protein [Pararcticibacter amylolyticus]|uniref:DUF1572 domain-containing protein n=2 Tax=Pararcticibacter amylolyticus TaxID=2173175 RepID=A0A2U2PJP7_9SPHI|nr:DUF1572 domain-containing protein [Pararcticibacter amylolyticus]
MNVEESLNKNSIELANRFREVILSGTWIANTNFKNELIDVNWEIAVTQFQNLNTICRLAQHVHYYIAGIKSVLAGGRLNISDKYSFDFLPVASQSEWDDFLWEFWKDAGDFASLVEQLSEQKLNEVFVEEKYGTYKRNIDAMIEHSYYHLGQIVLIKKMLIAVDLKSR